MVEKKENKEALAVDPYAVGWMLKKQSKLISFQVEDWKLCLKLIIFEKHGDISKHLRELIEENYNQISKIRKNKEYGDLDDEVKEDFDINEEAEEDFDINDVIFTHDDEGLEKE